jgi:hypothetical protein
LNRPVSSWSARRAAVAAEAEAEEHAAHEAIILQQRAELAERSDEDILEELGLPDPESLKLGDDFKAFMSKAVPEHLRKRALRKLWRSNPVLACVDGLNDYDDDYLTGSTGQGVIKTGYQVGKGMLAHLLEVERLKTASPVDTLVPAEPEDVLEEVEQVDVVIEKPDNNLETAFEHEVVSEEIEAPVPRRMQFQFEDDNA